MSDHVDVIQEVRELWNGFIENELDTEQKQRFDELLKSNPQARAEYIGLMNMHGTLSRYLWPGVPVGNVLSAEEDASIESLYNIDLADILSLEDGKVEKEESQADHNGGSLIFDFLQAIPGRLSNNTFQIFVLLALLLPGVFAFMMVLTSSKPVSIRPPKVARMVLAEWKDDQPIKVGAYLTEGERYDLTSGFVEIGFANGAEVIVQGPAAFIVDSHKKVQLESGRCVAHVPPSAAEFTIEANGSKIVDLGTEFGVETSPDMETDVFVFKGKVELSVKNAPQIGKIQLTTNEGVRSSAKSGVITPTKIDTDRFIRTLTANGVLGNLPIKNESFEEPNLSQENWTKPDGTLRSVPISYWHVSAPVSQKNLDGKNENSTHLQNSDIGYYLWSPRHGPKHRLGVTDGEQACILTLRDGETQESKVAWVYYSLGRIRPQDVGHSLELSVDCFARTPESEDDAKITLAFATKASAQSSGSFVGETESVTGSEIWGRSKKVNASFVMPIELVGRELFIVIRVEDDSPGSGEDLYLIDNLELEHYHP